MDRERRKHMGAAGYVPALGPDAHLAAWIAWRTMQRQIRENDELDLVPYETRWDYDLYPSLNGLGDQIVAAVRVRFQERYPIRYLVPWTVAA
jgi:hypothetical protein